MTQQVILSRHRMLCRLRLGPLRRLRVDELAEEGQAQLLDHSQLCFNCESACGILAYVDKEKLTVRKIEGNPLHPAAGAGHAPRAS
jgi:anaerobic selenocysteine-containing dehydrogenase